MTRSASLGFCSGPGRPGGPAEPEIETPKPDHIDAPGPDHVDSPAPDHVDVPDAPEITPPATNPGAPSTPPELSWWLWPRSPGSER